MTIVRSTALLSLALLGAAPAVAEVTEEARTVRNTGPEFEQSARVTLRAVRLRIDPLRGADPDLCASLDLDDLVVTLGGRRLPPESLVDLERRQVPTLHALLIDTSASMIGRLDFVRDAAASYVRHLRPGVDRALVATFDEDTILVQAPTDDRDLLLAGIERMRMGHATSLHDGLYHIIDELNAHAERPVIVLLTDGVDTASLYERDDVNALAEMRPDLTVFAVGYALPDVHAGRAGVSSAKRFLQNLARRTGGEFFDVPTASRLDRAYLGIRRLLAGEAVLMLTDPEPEDAGIIEGKAGRVKVRSKLPACRVTVFRDESGAPRTDTGPDDGVPAERLPLVPGTPVRVRYGLPGSMDVPERCRGPARELPEAACFVEALPDRLAGCALDVAMDSGMLYSSLGASRWEINDWIDLRVRPFEVVVPDLAALPDDPVHALDALAEHAVAVADADVATDPRKQPARHHARPYVDFPTLINGRTFLDTRDMLATALFRYPDYADWVRAKLVQETERELAALSERCRRVAPDLSEVELERVVEASAAGRRGGRRARAGAADDLQQYLGAWLGDVPASTLFTRWEVLHANRLLADDEPAGSFLPGWSALHRVFFVPSYARILTLLYPVHDPAQDRIGFWRVVLPRVSWLLPRVKNSQRHPEFADLPLDLIPDAPLGFLALKEQQAHHPQTGRRLRAEGYRVTAVSYELSGKPWRRDPPRAFRNVRVTVDLGASPAARRLGTLQLFADMQIAPGTGTVSIASCEWRGARAEGLPPCMATIGRRPPRRVEPLPVPPAD